jgi:hypothetical protein
MNSKVVSPFTTVSRERCVTTKTGTPKPGFVAPAVDHVVHRAADDPGASGGEDLVEVVLVDADRRAARPIVGPRAAENPVVQALATVAESRSNPVVGAGDVSIQ